MNSTVIAEEFLSLTKYMQHSCHSLDALYFGEPKLLLFEYLNENSNVEKKGVSCYLEALTPKPNLLLMFFRGEKCLITQFKLNI